MSGKNLPQILCKQYNTVAGFCRFSDAYADKYC